jgi:hypothetical protein
MLAKQAERGAASLGHSLAPCDRMRWSILWALCAASAASADPGPCDGRKSALVVWTGAHRLFVCEADRAAEEYPVALGRGGTSGPREYSDKTPLGTWSLSAPRASNGFGTFISFLGLYGLHGPPRSTRNGGRYNVTTDWTLGCVAVETDAVIDRLADWVRAHPSSKLSIEPGP